MLPFQEFVVGGNAPANWPASLKSFASECVTLTQELIQSASHMPPTTNTKPNSSSLGSLCANKTSRHLYYQCLPCEYRKAASRKVKPKKHHEIEIMSAFICDLLQNSLLLSEVPFPSDFGHEVTFQTAAFEGGIIEIVSTMPK